MGMLLTTSASSSWRAARMRTRRSSPPAGSAVDSARGYWVQRRRTWTRRTSATSDVSAILYLSDGKSENVFPPGATSVNHDASSSSAGVREGHGGPRVFGRRRESPSSLAEVDALVYCLRRNHFGRGRLVVTDVPGEETPLRLAAQKGRARDQLGPPPPPRRATLKEAIGWLRPESSSGRRGGARRFKEALDAVRTCPRPGGGACKSPLRRAKTPP